MATIALIFPGQGSQSPGMLKELAAAYPVVQRRFQEASDVLKLDLWQISQDETGSQLDQTAITQPALLAAGIACADILRDECGINAPFMAGHSLGEYTALCAARAMSFAEAIQLVHMRGKIMQEAVAPGAGAMAAILGLADEDVISVCNRTPGKVSAANFNSPGQVVIAGETAAVEAARGAQRYQPVRWVDCIEALAARGVNLFIEAGPGKVLTGLNKRIDKTLRTIAFDHPDSVAAVRQALSETP